MKRVLKWLMIVVALGVCVALALVAYARYWFETPNYEMTNEILIEIAPGTGFNAIVDELAGAGAIHYPLMFKAMVWQQGKAADFKAGEYQFDLYMSPADIMNKLVSGDVIIHAITIPEGWNVREVLAELAVYEILSGDVLPAPAEGSLMPDTYHVHRGDQRAAVMARMQQAMKDYLAAHWSPSANLPVQNAAEWVVLASVVEKETGLSSERPQVASVFINRLRRGMPLQSDPTVVYGIEQASGQKMTRALLKKDLETDHPYNTYLHVGLPPAPICNPGKASLEAVLNAPQTNYLYFVATGSGGHHFSATLAEHNANVSRYRAVLRQQKRAP